MIVNDHWQTLQGEVRRQYDLFDRKITECIDGYVRAGGRVHCGKGGRVTMNVLEQSGLFHPFLVSPVEL